MLKKLSSPLFLIITLALVLRLVGINHGFPFIFHPDEPAIVRGALDIRFNKNPGHFDWPHLYLYINYFVFMLFAKLRDLLVLSNLKESISTILPIIWNDSLVFYSLSRILSAIIGALTCIPIYLSAKNLFDEHVGTYSALVFSLIPFHVHHSHYALGDVPMVFLLSWVVYFSTKIMKENDAKNYVLAGVFTGLSASVKYNGGLVAITVLLAHLYRVVTSREEKIYNFDSIMNLIFSGVCSIGGFLLGTPFALIDFKTFIRTDSPKGALWQFTNVGTKSSTSKLVLFFNNVYTKIPDDVGYTPIILFIGIFLLLIGRLILRKRKSDDLRLWFLVIPGLALTYYIGGFSKTRSHYFMISYPFITIITGYCLSILHRKLKSKYLSIISISLVMAPLVILSSQRAYTFYREDTRLLLRDWIVTNKLSSQRFLYSSKSLGDVLEDVVVEKYYGYEYLNENPNPVGVYVVVSHDEESPEEIFNRYTFLPKMELENSIDNSYRKGPKLSIYLTVDER